MLKSRVTIISQLLNEDMLPTFPLLSPSISAVWIIYENSVNKCFWLIAGLKWTVELDEFYVQHAHKDSLVYCISLSLVMQMKNLLS